MPTKAREKFKVRGTVFDNFTIKNLQNLSGRGFFDLDTLTPVSLGKEANIFAAQRDDTLVAVKIYRLENCDFNNMWEYMRLDPRYSTLKKSTRDTIFAWCQREFRNMFIARAAGLPVPTPIIHWKNVLIMEFIGDDSASPKLKDSIPKEPEKFLDLIIKGMTKLYKAGFIHCDLSAFNILNHNEKPVFIDFSQAIPTQSPNSEEYLDRDIKNVSSFFEKLKIKVDPIKIKKKITK